MQNRLLTPKQAADMLQINVHTLDLLVQANQVPCIRIGAPEINTPIIRFKSESILDWLKNGPILIQMNTEKYLERLKQRIQTRYPEAIARLKELDKCCVAPRVIKGYNLTKVPNKKTGFTYYVRYIEKGKLVSSRWSTHTTDYDLAVQFAVENRVKLLAQYHSRTEVKKPSADLYPVMEQYYAEDSPYLKIDARRGRSLGEVTRRIYQQFMIEQWVPYLKKQKVTSFDQIDTPFMARFQNYCLANDKKPQTIAHYISMISLVFDHLLIIGVLATNPCASLVAVKITDADRVPRGCYETASLQGVFNTQWKDEKSYLLCLLIYTTGMRNSEIERLQVKDIISIGGYRFIDIPKSKTKNGVRIVPLHDFVYQKLAGYIQKKSLGEDSYIFTKSGGELSGKAYLNANVALGEYTGYDRSRLDKEHISFYSGRHFWKTLMNSEGLGETEEYFMGHKVSSDVAKRYNHRDKQGQEKLLEKTREVFRILDRRIF